MVLAGPRQIASWLHELADRVAFAGENPFKVRAYREAARRLEKHAIDLSSREALEGTPGIGRKIADKIMRMAEGEMPPGLARRRQEQPPELSWLLRLPGVGPSTARKLWAAGIGTVSGLADHLAAGEELPGVTPAQRRQLLRAFAERRRGVPLPDLLALTESLGRVVPGLVATGGVRRLDPLVERPRWLAPDRAKSRRAWHELLPIVLEGAWAVAEDALLFVPEQEFGTALLWHTGPESFLAEMGEALGHRGLRLDATKLYDGERQVACFAEDDVFECAGMTPIPPPLRGIAARARDAAVHTVRGDLHSHSNWSDGLADIPAMARAAVARGYAYLAVTDHSQGLKVANGLTPERFRAQRREIEELRTHLPEGFSLLQGCEVDIHADGSLDLPDDLLQEFDVVIASVHNHFDQSTAAATERLVRAIRHPLVTAIGHPGARKLGERPPIAADWQAVFDAAASCGTALEINASPRRLDLDFRWLEGRNGSGLSFVIDSDAHSTHELEYMPLGIAQAQKAGLRQDQVLNARPVDGLRRAHG